MGGRVRPRRGQTRRQVWRRLYRPRPQADGGHVSRGVARLGKDPEKARVSGSLHGVSWLVVSSDPGRDFNLWAPGVMYWYGA